MQTADGVPAVQEKDPTAECNRREVIRFLSADERLKALQALMDAYTEQLAKRAAVQANVIARSQQNSAGVASPAQPGETGA